ncbi:hypothetical protein Thermo_00278 [Thermoplasmatales archaeon]|nr:hypothetical protein Thermo_00278 [Thermoplasmatales archaeon]
MITGKKREPAKWILSKELKDTNVMEDTHGEDQTKPYIITPLGTRVKRIIITGMITSKNVDDNLTKATIADNSGAFYISAFSSGYNAEAKFALDSMDLDSAVMVMGRVNPFKTEEGVFYFNINPEMVVRTESMGLEMWKSKAVWIALRKIYAIREALKAEDTDVNNLTSIGYSTEEAECAIRAKKHYHDYDFQEFSKIAESVLKFSQEKNQNAELKELILAAIRKNDTDGKGCKYEDILSATLRDGVERVQVDEILNTLGSEGEVYEVSLKRFKAI